VATIDHGPVTVAALRAVQLERLRATLAHAETNSPHYAKAFAVNGVAASDLGSLGDLVRFPFTSKADLRATYPFGMFAVPREQVARVHASSGTTGQPTVVGYTAGDLATWAELVARSLYAGGVRPGMMVHIAYGYGLFTGGLGAHYGAEALGCTVVPMSGGQTARQVQLISDFRPDAIMVTPSYMLALLDGFRAAGVDPRDTSLRFGVFGAEPWTDAVRREIEDAFGLTATDIYGLSEVMGPGVAQQFAGDEGATIWEDHFLPEIVDPESGEPLPDGELGELVLTSLTKQALPIVRYRTRDLTRLLPGERTPMRRMARIGGRCDDMLIVRGVNLFPTQVEEQVLRQAALSPHFLIEIVREERMDAVLIHVEPRAAASLEDGRSASQTLATSLKEATGLSMAVSVAPPGTLERSTGKAARVIDRRPA